jgi:hypothetical protein
MLERRLEFPRGLLGRWPHLCQQLPRVLGLEACNRLVRVLRPSPLRREPQLRLVSALIERRSLLGLLPRLAVPAVEVSGLHLAVERLAVGLGTVERRLSLTTRAASRAAS